ncbi:MAG: aldehyde dehydrogenase family protein, partial [Solirubrobacterales bacterium]|nr:aldehyde dehydrogenase family protein [Solirubrobacterales bacterium]
GDMLATLQAGDLPEPTERIPLLDPEQCTVAEPWSLLAPLDWGVPFDIELQIRGPAGETVFEGRTSTAGMRRSIDELIEFLCRDDPLPAGTVLLTGTGIVPPDGVTLTRGQTVEIIAAHLARALDEAGLPDGVLNVVVGRGSEVGEPLVTDERVRAISFTGSVQVGHEVRDHATMLGKRVQLELRGRNPLIVAADATLDAAVQAAYAGRAAVRGRPRRHRARAPGRRDGARGRRARRSRRLPDRAHAVRRGRRRRLPVLRGGVRTGELAVPLHHARRGGRARQRGPLRALGVHLHPGPRHGRALLERA